MQSIPSEVESDKKTHPKILLRIALLAHLAEFDDPILKALQGSGLSILEVASVWIELGLLVSETRCNAIERGYSLEEAFAMADRREQDLADRIKARIQEGAL